MKVQPLNQATPDDLAKVVGGPGLHMNVAQKGSITHLANGPWKKSLNLYTFPY